MFDDDIIDLTSDFPTEEKDQEVKKRHLTDTGNDNEDEMSRQRIMNFARGVAKSSQPSPAARNSPPIVLPPSPPHIRPSPEDTITLRDDDPILAKQRIMSFATAINRNTALDTSTIGTHSTANHLLAQLHNERTARRVQAIDSFASRSGNTSPPPIAAAVVASREGETPTPKTSNATSSSSVTSITILSWNVWFREDVACTTRINAISQTIQVKNPDVICLQEVTPYIYTLLSSSPWWSSYSIQPTASEALQSSYFTVLLWKKDVPGIIPGRYGNIPFENSVMGRDLKIITLDVAIPFTTTTSPNNTRGNGTNKASLSVATSHLESPTSWKDTYSQSRVAQCTQALSVLDMGKNDVVFIGDLNWSEKNDRQMPFPSTKWIDAWKHSHPTDPGYTYDQGTNRMLRKGSLRLRLDRALCRLEKWNVSSIAMVGQEAIAGAVHENKPVYPSDHYGLLLNLVVKNE